METPNKTLLSEYGCKAEKFFVLDASEALEQQQMFGIELEYIYAPNVSQMACIAFLLKAEMLTLHDLRMNSLSALSNISFMLMEPMKTDGENDELVLYPMSLQAARNLKSHFGILFRSLTSHGYEPWGPLNYIGMHISVERNQITVEALERLLWWLYHNNKLFVFMTGRKSYSTIKADIHHLMGDKYHTWDEDKRRVRAEEIFSIFINAFQNRTFADIIGIRTYLDKPYIQFTHFGSTLSEDQLLTKIEFIDYLLTWVGIKDNNNPNDFVKAVSSDKYPHLFAELKALKL